MLRFDHEAGLIVGPHGSIPVPADDEAVRKLVMLLNGECLGQGPLAAAEAAGYCKQRYYQLRASFSGHGSASLRNRKPGPRHRSSRTDELIRQVIRHRFLDPEASPEVIAQRLRQSGLKVSTRGVERVIAHFGLQKKTPPLQARRRTAAPGGGRADA